MSDRRAGAALGLLLALAGCGALVRVPAGPPPVPDELLERRFTPDEVAADVADFFAILEEVHPAPYELLPAEEVARRRAALVASLDRPLLRRELQPRLAALVAALGDGHTSVHLPMPEWWRRAEAPEGCFPLDLAWDEAAAAAADEAAAAGGARGDAAADGLGERAASAAPSGLGAGLLVRRTAVVTGDGHLAAGARVLSISGRPAVELFRTFLARQSGETEAFRAAAVERALPVHLWLEGIEPPYLLSCVSASDSSRRFDIEAPGMAWGALARGAAPAGGPRWGFDRRPDRAAVLTLDTFGGELGAFEDFLAAIFAELRREPPRALVIDLRRNGGGDSRLGDALLHYLCDRPWRQSARKDWKASERYRAFLKTFLPAWLRWLPLQYLHPTGWRLWTTPAGETAVFELAEVRPRDEPDRYSGPLAWLIGRDTFSSAASLAQAVEHAGLGLLAGEETGGVCNGFGEVLPVVLPRTRLAAQVSSARFLGADGDPSRRGGVRPQLVVPAGAAARREGGVELDAALEAAVARLLAPDAPPAP